MMKRMMSLLLCAILLASSCLPAYAEIQEETKQIHFAGETIQTAGIKGSDLKAEFSKTLTEAEGENNFNLTLTVKTNQDVTMTEGMGDAAVVLVFDLSGSMGYSETAVREDFKIKNPGDGPKYEFDPQNPDYGINDQDADNDGKVVYPQLPSSPSYDPDGVSDRLEKAKYAAFQFLEKFATVTNGDTNAKREVAIVVFTREAYVVKVNGANWTNIASPTESYSDGYKNVEKAIVSLIYEGSTNTEAGMQVAYNLYENENLNKDVLGIQNRNIILMTDGVPIEFIPNSVYGNTDDTIEAQADYLKKLSMEGITLSGINGESKETSFKIKPDHIDISMRPADFNDKPDPLTYRDSDRDYYSDWGPSYAQSLKFGSANDPYYEVELNKIGDFTYPTKKEEEEQEAFENRRDGEIEQFLAKLNDEDYIKYTDHYDRFPYMRRVVPYNGATQTSEMGRHIISSGISLYGIPIDMPYLYVQKKEIREDKTTLSTSANTLAGRIYTYNGKRIGIPQKDDDNNLIPLSPDEQETMLENAKNFDVYEGERGSEEWFREWCTDAFRVDSNTASSWTDAFNRIFELIEASSSAWVVEDVLSEDFVQTADKSIVYSSNALPEKVLPVRVDENKMLVWDLKDMVQPKLDSDGYYTYTCTIPVTLVNTGTKIEAWSKSEESGENDDLNGASIRTNALLDTDDDGGEDTESAKLNCVFVTEASDGAPQLLDTQILNASSPEVHALYSAGIQLTKKYVMIDKNGKPVTDPKPLAGAQFELTVNSLLDPSSYDEREIKTAVNNALKVIYAVGGTDATDTTGLVKTTTLPAGDYTLVEKAAPNGYIASTDAYHFIVSYGQVYHYYFVTEDELEDTTRFTPVENELGYYTDANGIKVKAEYQSDEQYKVISLEPYSMREDAPSLEDRFLNKTQVGALNIVKEIESNFKADEDREFEFRITLKDEKGKLIMGEEREPALPDGDGEGEPDTPPEDGEQQKKEYVSVFNSNSHGVVTFVNGVATVKVSRNNPLRGLSLPHGVYYSVEEIDDPAFEMVAGENLTGEIKYDDQGQTASVVSFINTRRTGDLEITKIVTPYVDHPRDTQYEFQFTLTIDCDPSVSPPITGTCGDLEFVDGVATFTLKHGETVKATGLPAGATYTLEEYGPGYNVVCDNMTGTIVEGKAVKIVVENVEIYVDQPLTGDNSRLGLMLALLAISVAGLAVIAVRRRRSRSNG